MTTTDLDGLDDYDAALPTFAILARIVTVSVDAHTAVTGVHEDLVAAGLTPDEVWAERQVA